MRPILFVFAALLFASCQEIIEAPVPDLSWAEFDAPGAAPLSSAERTALEGIYGIGQSGDDFGKEAALKWTYVAGEKDTAHYLSFFCAEDVRYFICQAKKKGGKILLNGYWRNVENTKTGKAHFTISLAELNHEGATASDQRLPLGIAGTYGLFNDDPEKKIDFRYSRPLNTEKPYGIVAHRGGGRNNDLLPASENSVEMIPLAAQLGANGIEIDVQFTKDGVPVLFHDANVNDRLTTKTGIHGAIDTYTWEELKQEITLKRGGKLPTLEQALETVLTKTPLEFVWLDCKYKTGLDKVVALQKKFTDKAKGMGKKLEIVIGIPDEDVMGRFIKLPDYKNIPSLCELDTALASKVGANIWAPSWIKGHQSEIVTAVQATGKRSFVWTVDNPRKIKEFMYEAKFNGMCTNRPTMAAYYYYARQ
ncbi:MAG TPA: glycerophosphodiester phosphodiesterase family protein [Flavisolibacter sp.]|nr:glycerophosphodiester phosphodiesterase family protein [Flavisolibacter sp.]